MSLQSTVSLPRPTSSFVGRVRELRQGGAALTRHRIVTIVGPGGVGKTRLVLELARSRVRRHGDGVIFVDLAAAVDAAAVESRVIEAVAGVRGTRRVGVDVLAKTVGDRKVLLVLDNCEHVIATVAALVIDLVSRTSMVRVLATSREPLRVSGEAVFRLPPMSAEDSFQLFVERSRASRSGTALAEASRSTIAEVCARLDGLPLAIELAAARSRVLSPAALLPMLVDRFAVLRGGPRDAPPRHQALRAAIDSSYALLGARERELFNQLAVFRGGFDLGAAVSVCGQEALDVLSALVDKSMIVAQGSQGANPRFAMLETLREYGLERLNESGAVEAARKAHLWYFVDRAETTYREGLALGGMAQGRELEADLDNIRAALEWSVDTAPEAGLRLVGAARDLWFMRAQADGLASARRLLERTAAAASPARSRALVTAGHMANTLQLPGDAREFFEEACRLCRESGDAPQLAWATWGRGVGAFLGRDIVTATAVLLESLGMFEVNDDTVGRGRATASLGALDFLAGDYAAARTRLREALVLMRAVGDHFGEGMARTYLGLTARMAGSGSEAQVELRAAIRLLAEIGDVTLLTFALAGLALNTSMAEVRRAVRLAAAATTTRRLIGGDFAPVMTEAVEGLRLEATRRLGAAAAGAEWSAGAAMGLDAAVAYALGDRTSEPASLGTAPLSARESEIARLLARGMANREIADHFHLSVRTVENHAVHILNKLGLENRTQVAAWMLRRDAATPAPPPPGAATSAERLDQAQ